MEIVRLPLGKQAPVDADCVRIEEQAGGTYKLTGSALCVADDDDDDASVSIVDAPLFATFEQAEETALAWATQVGSVQLFVSRGTLAHPLESIEIDGPL